MSIVLPHDWECREYQDDLWHFLDAGGKRAALKWHRRSGKDATALHWTTVASQRRTGSYWHMLPTLRQGRKAIWEESDGGGNRILDAWPGWRNPSPTGLVQHIRHDEMKIELAGGSTWYVVGSDNYDSLMSTNPVGIVFSEWSLSNSKAWDFIRPILTENGGWAIFIWTPRGRNHASILYRSVQNNPDWFTQTLTVDDTRRPDGTPVILPERIQAERDDGATEAHLLQEYWCSEEAPLEGAIWAEQMIKADEDGRICNVPHDPSLLVDTWWDIGYSDATAVWFTQQAGGEIHLIDYDEASGREPGQDVAMLHRKRDQRGFVYGRHIWPHDGAHKTKASRGRPLYALYGDLGIHPEVQPRPDVEVAIQRARQILPRCWFDKKCCAAGLDTLRGFKKREDEARSAPDRPYYVPGYVHDWASHGATAFYTGALTFFDPKAGRLGKKRGRYEPKEGGGGSHWSA